MSQDEVLKKWLERLSLTSHLDYFVDDQDSCSKAAMLCRFNENDIGRTWRAAVEHTLAFVAEELCTSAQAHGSTDLIVAKDSLHLLARRVLKMNP